MAQPRGCSRFIEETAACRSPDEAVSDRCCGTPKEYGISLSEATITETQLSVKRSWQIHDTTPQAKGQ